MACMAVLGSTFMSSKGSVVRLDVSVCESSVGGFERPGHNIVQMGFNKNMDVLRRDVDSPDVEVVLVEREMVRGGRQLQRRR